VNPPKPTALKFAQGTWRRDRANPNEPQLEALTESPAPPAWLTGALRRRLWRELSAATIALRVLTSADVDMLALTVDALGSYVEARDEPGAWRRADAARKAALTGLREFGLTPAARTRVRAVPPVTPHPLLDRLKPRLHDDGELAEPVGGS
jgi:phage terminase small subunit